MIQYKETKKLYLGKYQHKIVLISNGIHIFRSGNLDTIFKKLSEISVSAVDQWPRSRVTDHDIDYMFQLYECFQLMDDYKIRVESPWLSIYTNDSNNIQKLKDIDITRVRLIHQPVVELKAGQIISKLPYDFKIYVKNKSGDYEGFLQWAKDNENVKLTASVKDLFGSTVWPQTSYFYVKGEKNLTVAKLYLGNLITRIEEVVQKVPTD